MLLRLLLPLALCRPAAQTRSTHTADSCNSIASNASAQACRKSLASDSSALEKLSDQIDQKAVAEALAVKDTVLSSIAPHLGKENPVEAPTATGKIKKKADAEAAAWKTKNGYILNSDDLHVETMTVEEAKLKCKLLPGCQAFCHAGNPTKKAVSIHFKAARSEIYQGDTPWTTYWREEDIRLGSRVKVNFKGEWYEGTVKKLPDDSVSRAYEVNCDIDPPNVVTLASKLGEDIAPIGQAVWIVKSGFIPSGENLHTGVMTTQEAKLKCAQLTGCQGFCHPGPPTSKAVQIFFKASADVHQAPNTQWTAFLREEASDDAATLKFHLANRGRMISATGSWRRDAEHHHEDRWLTVPDTLQILLLLALGFLLLFLLVEGMVFCIFKARAQTEEPKSES